MSETGKLEKLRIKAFSTPEQNEGDLVGEFEAFYNPTSMQASFALKYKESVPEGQTKMLMEYGGYEAASFSFELLVDGTNASIPSGLTKDNASLSVSQRIEKFKSVTYDYNGDIHRTNYLQIVWSENTIAKCVLVSVNITYDLFSSNGEPLRAKLACSFKEYSYLDLIKAEEGKKSPDVTHIRVVQQGDRLPTMCERIYGDAKLYLQVARANNLLDYRNLVPGSKIFFPPLAKN